MAPGSFFKDAIADLESGESEVVVMKRKPMIVREALDEELSRRIDRAVQELSEELAIADAIAAFESQRLSSSTFSAPVLHLEDVTGIPFLDDIAGIEEYQHRARVRAADGDLFAAVTDPVEGYEDYCQSRLGLGAPDFVQLVTTDNPRAVAKACLEGAAFDRIVGRAKAGGGLVVHPYMAIESIWQMAATIADAAAVPVQVIGPPPPVLWVANDKSHLSELITRVVGEDYVVETKRARTTDAIAATLHDMSRHHDLVGLKRTRCASAMGNLVFDGRALRRDSLAEVRATVDAFLRRTQWSEGEDVLIVEWVPTDLSPSTQLWIPPLGEGSVILEGIYEQLLKGPEKVFVGSRPSTLPAPVNAELARTSLVVASALQKMGYVGRCSFDFIVSGDIDADFQVKFTECNGRWGGTSTPMHLVDRLIEGPRPAYIAKDYFLDPSLVGMAFVELLDRLGDELFDLATGRGRFIFYNVGPFEEIGKLDIIALGASPDDAHRGVEEILPQLLGL